MLHLWTIEFHHCIAPAYAEWEVLKYLGLNKVSGALNEIFLNIILTSRVQISIEMIVKLYDKRIFPRKNIYLAYYLDSRFNCTCVILSSM